MPISKQRLFMKVIIEKHRYILQQK